MILYIGSSADRVYPTLVKMLQKSGHPFLVVDEDQPDQFSVTRFKADRDDCFRIQGDQCSGKRGIGSIFVRHAVARTLDSSHLQQMGALQANLNSMMLCTSCPIINNPANAYSNYSKPYQLGLMAEAGFSIPKTLVTNDAAKALEFYRSCNNKVIFKGVSNVMTFAQRLTDENLARLELLPNSPTVFQEFIEGADYRVHVVGDQTFSTRLQAKNEDYRRSALADRENITAEAADLPPQVIRACVGITRQLGLIVSGIDFKEDSDGRLFALEVNPYPQFTFYEGRSGQKITQGVVDYLVNNQIENTNVFA